MMGALPEEVLALRKTAEHVVNLQAKMIASLPKVSSTKLQKLDREKTVINLYAAGHPIDEDMESKRLQKQKFCVPYSEQAWHQTQ